METRPPHSTEWDVSFGLPQEAVAVSKLESGAVASPAKAFPGTTYGSQSFYMPQENALHSSGSFGQIGFSDMDNGISVVMNADWANNGEPNKFEESRARVSGIINARRGK